MRKIGIVLFALSGAVGVHALLALGLSRISHGQAVRLVAPPSPLTRSLAPPSLVTPPTTATQSAARARPPVKPAPAQATQPVAAAPAKPVAPVEHQRHRRPAQPGPSSAARADSPAPAASAAPAPATPVFDVNAATTTSDGR